VKRKAEALFSEHGIPSIVKTGPPFNSREFSEFAKYMGFQHRKVTIWRQANGQVESTMKKIVKVIQIAKLQLRN